METIGNFDAVPMTAARVRHETQVALGDEPLTGSELTDEIVAGDVAAFREGDISAQTFPPGTRLYGNSARIIIQRVDGVLQRVWVFEYGGDVLNEAGACANDQRYYLLEKLFWRRPRGLCARTGRAQVEFERKEHM